jgi:hypothetical protein
MIGWLRSTGGYFNPNLEIRRSNPMNSTFYFGIVAEEDIALNETLMEIV